MTFAGAPSTLALPDHADHIHVGFAPHGSQLGAAAFGGTLDAKGWRRLIDRLAAVGNPRVAASPSPGALAVVPQAAVPQAAVPQAGVPQVPGP
jgi:hypothetical protein